MKQSSKNAIFIDSNQFYRSLWMCNEWRNNRKRSTLLVDAKILSTIFRALKKSYCTTLSWNVLFVLKLLSSNSHGNNRFWNKFLLQKKKWEHHHQFSIFSKLVFQICNISYQFQNFKTCRVSVFETNIWLIVKTKTSQRGN